MYILRQYNGYKQTHLQVLLSSIVMAILFLSSSAMTAQVYQFDQSQIAHLKINLLSAKVSLKESTDSKLTITIQDSDFEERPEFKHQLMRSGQDLILTQKSYDSLSSLTTNMAKVKPILIDIAANHVIALNIKDLIFKADSYKKDLSIQTIKGDISLTKCILKLSVDQQKGIFNLMEHSGAVDLNFYQAQAKLLKVNGNVEMKMFLGKAELSQITGVINTQSSEAEVLVEKSQAYQFEARSGLVIFKEMTGRIDGSSTEGTVSAHLAKNSDIHLRTQTGKVFLHNHFKSGAAVNLMAEDGEIITSNDVKVYTVACQKIARGTLKGSELGGTVKIRTAEGSIIFK